MKKVLISWKITDTDYDDAKGQTKLSICIIYIMQGRQHKKNDGMEMI